MSRASLTLPIQVRLSELDLRDQVSCASLLRILEDTAMQASIHAGFGLDWYRARGHAWVIRTMHLENRAPARYLDELDIRTWISSMTRVRADRNYLVRRRSDRRVLARATANWVYLDVKTMLPTRMAPEILAIFNEFEPPAVSPFNPRHWLCPPAVKIDDSSIRRALYYEADAAQHINNAVYVDWFEEAIRDTLLSRGYPLPLDGTWALWFYRHKLEYVSAARPRDPIEVEVRLVGRGRAAGQWKMEIRRMSDQAIIARDDCTTVWVDRDGRPARWERIEK